MKIIGLLCALSFISFQTLYGSEKEALGAGKIAVAKSNSAYTVRDYTELDKKKIDAYGKADPLFGYYEEDFCVDSLVREKQWKFLVFEKSLEKTFAGFLAYTSHVHHANIQCFVAHGSEQSVPKVLIENALYHLHVHKEINRVTSPMFQCDEVMISLFRDLGCSYNQLVMKRAVSLRKKLGLDNISRKDLLEKIQKKSLDLEDIDIITLTGELALKHEL